METTETGTQEETKTYGENKTISYWIVGLCLIVSLFATFAVINSNNEAKEAKEHARIMASSTWVVLSSIMEKVEKNKTEWARIDKEAFELNKRVEEIRNYQTTLNISTEELKEKALSLWVTIN